MIDTYSVLQVYERQLCSSTSVNIRSTTSGFHSSVTVKSKEEELPCENKNTVIGHLKTGMKSLCRTTIGRNMHTLM